MPDILNIFTLVFILFTLKKLLTLQEGDEIFKFQSKIDQILYSLNAAFFTSFAILTPWIEGVRRVASFTPPKLFKWSLRTEGLSQLAIFLVEKDKNS